MSNHQTIRVRDAKNQSTLPDKLRNMKLLGSYQGNLYLGSECGDEILLDTLIFGYSVKDNTITGLVRLRHGAWPESWTQKDNLLIVGTRFGKLTAIDMENCKEVGHLENLGNAIDAIAINGQVYFGVNGQGLYKSDVGLVKPAIEKKKEHVVSALAVRDDKLFAFYFSNGNDPVLDGSPAGGLVEVLDKNLEVLSKRSGTPYSVTQAINTTQGLRFSTRNTSNSLVEGGEGGLYLLNHSNLSDNLLLEFPAAVNILREGQQGVILAGLKNGQVYEIEGKKRRVISSQEYGVTGLASQGKKIYAGSPNGEIYKIIA